MAQPSPSRPTPESWPARLARLLVRWRYLLALLAVLAVFGLSSLPHRRPPAFTGLDKIEHILEYLVVGLLFLNIATRGYAHVRPYPVLLAWLALVGVATLDELYQRWVPGRQFDGWDLAASATGGLLAVVLVLLTRRWALTLVRQRS